MYQSDTVPTSNSGRRWSKGENSVFTASAVTINEIKSRLLFMLCTEGRTDAPREQNSSIRNTIHILYLPDAVIKKTSLAQAPNAASWFLSEVRKGWNPRMQNYLFIIFFPKYLKQLLYAYEKTQLFMPTTIQKSVNIVNHHFLKSFQYFFGFQINSGQLSPLTVLIITEQHELQISSPIGAPP